MTVTADPVDYNTLLDEVTAATGNAQGLQFWGLAWVAEYPDPQDWLTRQFDSGVPDNSMNYGQNTSNDAARQQLTQKQMEQADANSQRMLAFRPTKKLSSNSSTTLPGCP